VGSLLKTINSKEYLLTIQYDLTEFSLAIPLETTDANTISKHFVKQVICTYGTPGSILTDQGQNFMSKVFANVCKLLQVNKFTLRRTTRRETGH